jgi:hypothetical protein
MRVLVTRAGARERVHDGRQSRRVREAARKQASSYGGRQVEEGGAEATSVRL